MFGVWRIREWMRLKAVKRASQNALTAVASFPAVHSYIKNNLANELVVSLTSYPPRFPYLLSTLKSLIDQTIRPDRIILWVAHEDLNLLPNEIINLREYGVEVRKCDNLRSYKKIIPSLIEFPDACIVTADDDLYYQNNWLELLIDSHSTNPTSIISHRAHMAIRCKSGPLVPYLDWEHDTSETSDLSANQLLFPTGGAGTLYPPSSLASEVTDRSVFTEICATADDVWLFWMGELAGSQHLRVQPKFPLLPWEGSEDVALWYENKLNLQNDVQIRAMETRYGYLKSSEFDDDPA